jgi:hypothetical protein
MLRMLIKVRIYIVPCRYKKASHLLLPVKDRLIRGHCYLALLDKPVNIALVEGVVDISSPYPPSKLSTYLTHASIERSPLRCTCQLFQDFSSSYWLLQLLLPNVKATLTTV